MHASSRFVATLEIGQSPDFSTRVLSASLPGEVLREEFMPPLELSSHALARAISVLPARVNKIANEARAITTDLALRFGRHFGTTADIWINLQTRPLKVTREQDENSAEFARWKVEPRR